MRGNKFGDSLFTSLVGELLPKLCLLLKERIYSKRRKLFQTRDKDENARVVSPESVHIHLKHYGGKGYFFNGHTKRAAGHCISYLFNRYYASGFY